MIYDQIAPFYDLFDADDPGALWHREFVLARAEGLEAVLDIGAGTGRTAMGLAERGLRVWAIEPSRGMRGVMLARLGDDTSLDDRLTILPGDARTCDVGRTFSLIVFSHALYLLDGPAARAAALMNLARHLAPDGRLIVDFALEEGRETRPRALAAERRIGESVFRRFSESVCIGDRRWAVTWTCEIEFAGQVVERVEETFQVATATLAECRAELAAAGLRPLVEYADYSGRQLLDPASASRYVAEAVRIGS
jgi:SAM-dependent methyltransferase